MANLTPALAPMLGELQNLTIALTQLGSLHNLTNTTIEASPFANVTQVDYYEFTNATAHAFIAFLNNATAQFLSITNAGPLEVGPLTWWQFVNSLYIHLPTVIFLFVLQFVTITSYPQNTDLLHFARQVVAVCRALPFVTATTIADIFYNGNAVADPLLRVLVRLIGSFSRGLSRALREIRGDYDGWRRGEPAPPRDNHENDDDKRTSRHPRRLFAEFRYWEPEIVRALPVLVAGVVFLILANRFLAFDWFASSASARNDGSVGNWEYLGPDNDVIHQAAAASAKPLSYRVLSDGTYVRFDYEKRLSGL
ncbi:hypothetical protein GGR51DRAFT_341306 [Nemania sp. FL0031]|nr:hypothetical protein GGR51DRAFT_341306 [Nemania sp. FL0031]